jgi:hypothetical protein
MDRSRYAIIWEIIRSGFGITILIQQGDWFGISGYFVAATYIMAAYFILSIIITSWFVYANAKEDRQMVVSL